MLQQSRTTVMAVYCTNRHIKKENIPVRLMFLSDNYLLVHKADNRLSPRQPTIVRDSCFATNQVPHGTISDYKDTTFLTRNQEHLKNRILFSDRTETEYVVKHTPILKIGMFLSFFSPSGFAISIGIVPGDL